LQEELEEDATAPFGDIQALAAELRGNEAILSRAREGLL
jgi:hypothetical protein